MKKFAVVISGCGVYDGAEIHETVMTLLAISKAGAEYQLFAPDMPQLHVINHLTGEVANETRNVLVEAARIARGNIKEIAEYNADDFDGLIFPGGFGAAKNLSTYAFDGDQMKVHEKVVNVVNTTHQKRKPIGSLCIAPVVIANILKKGVFTIGTDEGTASAIQSFGATHSNTQSGGLTIDKENKLVSAPCYMLGASIANIADEAEKLVSVMLELA